MRKLTALLAALWMAGAALPASGSTNDSGVFTATMQVGKTFLAADDCDKTGDGTVVGRGLYYEVSPLAPTRERHAVWHLKTTVTSVRFGPFDLELCGWMTAIDGSVLDPSDRWDGTGASCDTSKGHHGMGEFRAPGGGIRLAKVHDLGWKTATRHMIIMQGAYEEYGPTGDKLGKRGMATFTLLPLWGADCLAVNGAQSVAVAGTYKLANGVVPPAPPKFQSKECKVTDPNADEVKSSTESRMCPTGAK